MKRSGPSQDEFQVLRKRHSSMFSIATAVQDDDDEEEPEEPPIPNALVVSPPSSSKASSSASPPTSDTTEASSYTEEDGLFFFDEDEPVSDRLSNDASTIAVTQSFLPTATTTLSSPPQVLLRASVAVELKEPIVAKADETEDFSTGLVFESGTRHHDRHNRLHKERPLRITSILEALKNSDDHLYHRCCLIQDDAAATSSAQQFLDDDDFLRVHLPGYMKRLDRLSSCSCCDKLDREAQQYQSIFLTPDSVAEAKQAAASLCLLVSNVVDGSLDNGFAVIRPPGHHAEPSLAGGYCLLNNVAIAAAYARAKLDVERVLIVDWDVHHGNGTQSIFLDNPNVLYFSVHRWQGGNFYPFSPNGGPSHVGTGDGAGRNVNVGWSRKGMADEEYYAVWERLLMPMAREFQPDLVLVSAGFDAADGDMGECHVTPECFARLTRSLLTLAQGRVVCALEGGYVRSVLGKCVQSVVGALLNRNSAKVAQTEEQERIESDDGGEDVLDHIDPAAAKNIRSTLEAHKPYWKSLSTSD